MYGEKGNKKEKGEASPTLWVLRHLPLKDRKVAIIKMLHKVQTKNIETNGKKVSIINRKYKKRTKWKL